MGVDRKCPDAGTSRGQGEKGSQSTISASGGAGNDSGTLVPSQAAHALVGRLAKAGIIKGPAMVALLHAMIDHAQWPGGGERYADTWQVLPWMTGSKLAEHIGGNRNTVINNARKMEAAGVIKVTESGGYRSTRYDLLVADWQGLIDGRELPTTRAVVGGELRTRAADICAPEQQTTAREVPQNCAPEQQTTAEEMGTYQEVHQNSESERDQEGDQEAGADSHPPRSIGQWNNADIEAIIAAYPTGKGRPMDPTNPKNRRVVATALQQLRDGLHTEIVDYERATEDPAGWLLDRVKTWAESDKARKGYVTTIAAWMGQGAKRGDPGFTDDPAEWDDRATGAGRRGEADGNGEVPYRSVFDETPEQRLSRLSEVCKEPDVPYLSVSADVIEEWATR